MPGGGDAEFGGFPGAEAVKCGIIPRIIMGVLLRMKRGYQIDTVGRGLCRGAPAAVEATGAWAG